MSIDALLAVGRLGAVRGMQMYVLLWSINTESDRLRVRHRIRNTISTVCVSEGGTQSIVSVKTGKLHVKLQYSPYTNTVNRTQVPTEAYLLEHLGDWHNLWKVITDIYRILAIMQTQEGSSDNSLRYTNTVWIFRVEPS